MARRVSDTVDYFPHDARPGKTLAILENKFGLVGYAFWFKLLEILCTTDGHCLDLNDLEVWEYFLARVKTDDKTADVILDLLASLGNIDNDLWRMTRRVWCQALVDNFKEVYVQNRHRPLPSKPASYVGLSAQALDNTAGESTARDITTGKSTQSKVKESITKVSGKPDATPIIEYLNEKTGRRYTTKSKATVRLITARIKDGHRFIDFQRVIDAKVRAWGADPKMADYLRPETLFGTKFDSYLAACEPVVLPPAPAGKQYDMARYEATGELVEIACGKCQEVRE